MSSGTVTPLFPVLAPKVPRSRSTSSSTSDNACASPGTKPGPLHCIAIRTTTSIAVHFSRCLSQSLSLNLSQGLSQALSLDLSLDPSLDLSLDLSLSLSLSLLLAHKRWSGQRLKWTAIEVVVRIVMRHSGFYLGLVPWLAHALSEVNGEVLRNILRFGAKGGH